LHRCITFLLFYLFKMSYKVITDIANPALWKVLITAKYNNVNVEQLVGGAANAVKAKSPLGKVPILETKEGSIFGENAIVRYIAKLSKGHLYGNNEWEAAQIESYLDLASNDIDLPASVWIFPILGLINNNVNATNEAKTDIKKVFDFLNKTLLTKTYLVGERITIADIVVSLSLYYLYQKVLDNDFRKSYSNVNRWFNTLVHQPEFIAILGETKLCDKAEVAKEGVIVAKKEEKKKKRKKLLLKLKNPRKLKKTKMNLKRMNMLKKKIKKTLLMLFLKALWFSMNGKEFIPMLKIQELMLVLGSGKILIKMDILSGSVITNTIMNVKKFL